MAHARARAALARETQEDAEALHDTRAHAQAARVVAEHEADLAVAVARRQALSDQVEEGRRAETEAERRHAEATELVIDRRVYANSALGEGDTFRNKQAAVGISPASAVPAEPVGDLEKAFSSMADLVHEQAEAGSDHALRLDQAEKESARLRADVDRLDLAIRQAAEVHRAGFDTANPILVEQATRTAERA